MNPWTEVVLDSLYPGDRIRVIDDSGLTLEGWFREIDRLDYSILVDRKLEQFAGNTLGATVTDTVTIETRDIVRIERLAKECFGR